MVPSNLGGGSSASLIQPQRDKSNLMQELCSCIPRTDPRLSGIAQVQADALLVLELKDGSQLVWPPPERAGGGETLALAELPRHGGGSVDDLVSIHNALLPAWFANSLPSPPPFPSHCHSGMPCTGICALNCSLAIRVGTGGHDC